MLIRLFFTLRSLRLRQVFYLVYYRIFKKYSSHSLKIYPAPYIDTHQLYSIKTLHTCDITKQTFNFLNITHTFDSNLDWDLLQYGKLWTYNLNYFDWLYQPQIDIQKAFALMDDWNTKAIKGQCNIGMEPYPISLRIFSWSRFLLANKTNDTIYIQTWDSLYSQWLHLQKNIEYHLAGNHLLENACSLVYGALLFNDTKAYTTYSKLLTAELNEQYLDDGAHYECSAMYHAILLQRLLMVWEMWELTRTNNNFKLAAINSEFEDILRSKIQKACDWLVNIKWSDNRFPHFNDATHDVAPDMIGLLTFATSMGFNCDSQSKQLSQSGYRKYTGNHFEICADLGSVSPSYIPGHSHADDLNFELYIDKSPVVVDMGVSTYENNARRHFERSTLAHNTVTWNGLNSSDVWSSFRVGRRSYVTVIKDATSCWEAEHNGYAHQNGPIHRRKWDLHPHRITIIDSLYHRTGNIFSGVARFYLHPNVKAVIEGQQVILGQQSTTIRFKTDSKTTVNITLEKCDVTLGYNQLCSTHCIHVSFAGNLTTHFEFNSLTNH